MRRFLTLYAILMLSGVLVLAQTRVVTGTVTDAQGNPVPFATVTVKGTNTGVAALQNGTFSIQAEPNAVLEVSAAGFQASETNIGSQTNLNLNLSTQASLTEVVVTALGVRRTRNQVPYAAQQVAGEELSKTRSSNFLNNLSGKVSGLETRQSNTLGGSTNVVIRGSKSITGNNQALFVIDGVPFDNSNTNTNGAGRGDPNISQVSGRGGYDYGNSAADVNPDDIASITVLKGAAASALYGSRGSNGVILITTKKGQKGKGLGITINSGVTVGSIDKSTFVKYQKQYGGGYGQFYEDESHYFLYRDPNNGFTPAYETDADGNIILRYPEGRLVVPTSEDASYGGPFDPSLMVYQWDAFDPASPNFGKSRPWVAGANDPSSFYERSVSSNQSIYLDGGSDKGTFKLGYTRTDDKGYLPNSKIIKNLINFGGSYNLNSKFTAGASVNFSNIDGRGRFGTGYDDKNVNGSFRQWWQTNVDVKEQEEAYIRNKKNVTWNWADPTDLNPIYWDNIYFSRFENYETDTRNRTFGNVNLTYAFTDWLNLLGRVSLDTYDEIQEERQAKGSVAVPHYRRYNRSFSETNYDLMLNFDRDITTDINVKALVGTNVRKQHIQSIYASTNGGLIADRVYSLRNSANPIEAPIEADLRREVLGIFAGATFSWRDLVTLDGTIRRDASSTLPKGNNVYYYPSVSVGLIFSKWLPAATWLSYGKLRANYAEVGADAPIYSTLDAYSIVPPFGSNSQSSVGSTRNNPDLKPERSQSYEAGIEMAFLQNKVGFDASYYTTETSNQILPTTVSTATGYSSKFLNAGTMQNRGIEITVFATPVKTKNFSWTINVNWTRNRNKVLDLFEGSDNLLLETFQEGSMNATLGQPFPTFRGSNYVYYADSNGSKPGSKGQRIVMANGRYQKSVTSNEVVGNPNPDWIGGVNNTLKYKNLALSWLVDVRQGGDVFSLDLWYGMATGIYEETAGLNDLGKPVRNALADGGGIIRPGVLADGTPNTNRVSAVNFGAYGYRYSPTAAYMYDASYVKLREAVLTYSIPGTTISRTPFKGIDISFIGRNLWIIHKNLPYADPEETLGSGNLQGYQSGSYPTTRSFALNFKFRF